MNEYTALFCWTPLLIGVGIPVLMILGRITAYTRRAALKEASEQRAAAAIAIRQAKAVRDAELHEAKLARENNLVVLQDAKLELELLKIQQAKRKLGINDAPFTANDYPDPHVSSGTPPVRN